MFCPHLSEGRCPAKPSRAPVLGASLWVGATQPKLSPPRSCEHGPALGDRAVGLSGPGGQVTADASGSTPEGLGWLCRSVPSPSRLCPLPDSHSSPNFTLSNADSDSAGQDRGLHQSPGTGARRCPPSQSLPCIHVALFREAFPGHRPTSVPPQHPARFLHSSNRHLSLAFTCLLLTLGGCHSLSPTDCVFYTHTPPKPLPVVTLGLAAASACHSDLQNCKIMRCG